MSSLDTISADLTEADPAKSGPGGIQATVMEGPRLQANLEVVLSDEKRMAKVTVKTKEDGT